jgi:hypothetical protein
MAIDFITKLPVLVESEIKIKYDLIFVVTDKLTKYGYFILYNKKVTAQDLVYIFNQDMIL